MSDEGARRPLSVWIDADGQVWIEDPDAGAMPLARALQPDYKLEVADGPLGAPWLRAVRATPAPGPWPDDLPGLWAMHAALVASLPDPELAGPPVASSLLDLKRAIAARLFTSCVLCEHRCQVDRPAGERGVCKVGPTSHFGDAYIHQAEEREIAPSFCLAMTGCSWHCVYCHTADLINRVDAGTPLVPPAYDALYARLADPTVRTLSFVGGNPDHHLPAILAFLAAAPADFDRPVVWNSNMYGTPELYDLLEGIVDVHLGDFRYGNDACAKRLSALPRCWEPVTRNWLHVAQGRAAPIVRLLILPGHLECCLAPMVGWLRAHMPNARVSLLDQYHPTYLVAKRTPELDRRPTGDEVARATQLVDEAGLTRVLPVEG